MQIGLPVRELEAKVDAFSTLRLENRPRGSGMGTGDWKIQKPARAVYSRVESAVGSEGSQIGLPVKELEVKMDAFKTLGSKTASKGSRTGTGDLKNRKLARTLCSR